MNTYPPNFLSIPSIAQKISQGNVYRKKAKTDLRLPLPEEIGRVLDTHVFDVESQQLRVEISTPITQDAVIARNPGAIGKTTLGPIFNEWVVSRKDIEEKYESGILKKLTTEFSSHQKRQTVKAIPLTQELLNELKIKGDTLVFGVSWADTFMTAKVGDFLTDGGYSISQHDMSKTYERVDHPNRKDNTEKVPCRKNFGLQ